MAKSSKNDVRTRIHTRIRLKLKGNQERPRLVVFRSLKHIYAQVIDDRQGRTLAAASSGEKNSSVASGGNLAGAKQVGDQGLMSGRMVRELSQGGLVLAFPPAQGDT